MANSIWLGVDADLKLGIGYNIDFMVRDGMMVIMVVYHV